MERMIAEGIYVFLLLVVVACCVMLFFKALVDGKLEKVFLKQRRQNERNKMFPKEIGIFTSERKKPLI